MHIEIEPLNGVIIDNIRLELGMNKKTVFELIGMGFEIQNQAFYFNNELKIIFDRINNVEFIEFLGGAEGTLQPTVYNVHVFSTDATELLNILESKNNGKICDNYNGYSYSFDEISVGVYRENTPKNIEEMILEAKMYGNPLSEEEIGYEMARATHFATFGFGVKGYYK